MTSNRRPTPSQYNCVSRRNTSNIWYLSSIRIEQIPTFTDNRRNRRREGPLRRTRPLYRYLVNRRRSRRIIAHASSSRISRYLPIRYMFKVPRSAPAPGSKPGDIILRHCQRWRYISSKSHIQQRQRDVEMEIRRGMERRHEQRLTRHTVISSRESLFDRPSFGDVAQI